MKPFNHVDAASISDAASQLSASKGTAQVLAGGTDLLGVLEDRILPSYPTTLINLKTIPNLDYIKTSSSGLQIGAFTTLTEIANSTTVSGTYSLLSQAASQVATPQIRNMGTIAGNLCQAVRCWYYRYPDQMGGRYTCLRKGGTTCYAASGINTYHSIFGAPKGCNCVYPSDTATALVALNASIVTNSRTIPIESFFDALTGTVLQSGEMVTEVDVPTPPAGSKQTFTKFRIRKSIDFAIAEVATMVTMSGNTCTAARIALGGVAPTPLRSTAAEAAIVGKTLDANAAAAAASAAVSSATPLQYNGFKVPLLKTLITRALTS
jgi:xanthine dehydrogenase YagS FAD-binding subunit